MEYMKYYWGGMLSHGAGTFWELYNPENPAEKELFHFRPEDSFC